MIKSASTILALSALALAACDKDTEAQEANDQSQASTQEASKSDEPGSARSQAPVPVTVGEEGFEPSRIEVKSGAPVTLRFTRTTEKTCATEVAFPELGIKKPLPLNEPVDVQIPAKESRTLAFQCGMGMYKSQLVIN